MSLKAIAAAVLTPTLIKAVSDGYDWLCEKFSDAEPIHSDADLPPPVKKAVKKKPIANNKSFSTIQREMIINEHRCYVQFRRTVDGVPINNLDHLVRHLNARFKMNKSRSTYARVWNQK